MLQLNPPIIQTAQAVLHIVERHTHSGIAKFAHKSKFNAGENIVNLIALAAPHRMVLQSSGRYARTCHVGRDIGLDSRTGTQTDVLTVITGASGVLVTAFPGRP